MSIATHSPSDKVATTAARQALLLLLAELEAREAIDNAGADAAYSPGAVQAVVDLRSPRPSPWSAPDWADAARCL